MNRMQILHWKELVWIPNFNWITYFWSHNSKGIRLNFRNATYSWKSTECASVYSMESLLRNKKNGMICALRWATVLNAVSVIFPSAIRSCGGLFWKCKRLLFSAFFWTKQFLDIKLFAWISEWFSFHYYIVPWMNGKKWDNIEFWIIRTRISQSSRSNFD